ncbi:hypothetical protein IL306_002663 [Fusarium sp. DS 682]|nr:hypothetical protein IL306_002663 [Fusarium sp. DS 682]
MDFSMENISQDIYNATIACRSSLQSCLSIKPLGVNGWAENRLADFNLWAAGVGASAKTKASLDWRLHYQPKARIVLVSLLITLRDFIEECKDRGLIESGNESLNAKFAEAKESSSRGDSQLDGNEINQQTKIASAWFDALPSGSEDSDSSSTTTEDDEAINESRLLKEAMEATEDILDQLIRLGFAIRKSGTTSRLRKADSSLKEADYEGLKTHLAMLLMAEAEKKDDNSKKTTLQRTLDFQKGYEKLTSEQKQIIVANIRRRHRFNYARRHRKKLEEPPDLNLFPTVKPAVETVDFPQSAAPVGGPRSSSLAEKPKQRSMGALPNLAMSATTVSTVQGDILKAATPSQVSSRVALPWVESVVEYGSKAALSIREKVAKWFDGIESADIDERSLTLRFISTESPSETPDSLYAPGEYFAEDSENSSRVERDSYLSDSDLPTPSFDSTSNNTHSPTAIRGLSPAGSLDRGSEEWNSPDDELLGPQRKDSNLVPEEPLDPLAIHLNKESIESLQALLLYAARDGQATAVDLILRTGKVNVNTANSYSETPLLVAAGFGLHMVVRVCLAYGADINTTDALGRTPLSLAAGFGDIKTTKYLLEHGASVDAKDKLGRTSLFIAASNYNKDIAGLLLEFGADINAANNEEKTLLDCVIESDMAELLRAYREKKEL